MRKSSTTIISLISLLILVVIQVYVIYNYYEIKSKLFEITYSKAIQKTIEADENISIIDSLNNAFNKLAAIYLLKTPDFLKPSFQTKILTKFDSLLIKFDANSPKVKKYTLDNKLDTSFQTNYTIKEIYFLNFGAKIPIYNSTDKPEKGQRRKGIYIKSYYREGNYYSVQYDYYVDFTHKQKIIFTEIKGLLLMVILTITAVILTFAYNLYTLNRHKKLSELKDDFIDNISHEFKTPLSIISVSVSSLRKKQIQHDDQKYEEICNAIEKQNRVLSKMIDNVIDVNVLERNNFNDHKKTIPLKQYLNEVIVSFLTNETVGKNVQIIEEYLISDNFVYTLDPFQFNRAIYNLFNNSVKYCEREPVIKVRVLVNKHLKIEIEDNGIGVKDEHKELIFNKFYRASNPSKVKGLGLGLYIVKKIIETHNGSITLSSIPGVGTKVSITLPL